MKMDALRLYRDLGGVNGILHLITNSPYFRRTEFKLPTRLTFINYQTQGIPDKVMIQIILAYRERYGHDLDLAKYYYKISESKRTRPRPAVVYSEGRRHLRDDIANPMRGVLR